MSVASETSSVTYPGNGATIAFGTGFVFLANSEVRVTYKSSVAAAVVWTEGVHYSLTGAGSPSGGTATCLVLIPAVGDTVTLERVVPFTQPVAFRTQGAFSPSVHEDAFDESVFRDQQLDRRLKALESAGAVGSVVAGNGVSFTSTTLNVGAGNGIQVNADTVEVKYAAPSANVSKATAVQGTANFAARSDHKHDVDTAAPSATAVVIGNSASEGISTYLARADHQHQVLSGTPVNVTKATAAPGTATTFSRSDHKHDITTAAPSTIGTANVESAGSSASLARADHVHDHGSQSTPTHHAVATSGANGFMSAADKAKLDSYGSVVDQFVSKDITTTDATPTASASWTPTDQTCEQLEIDVAAKRQGSTSALGYTLKATFRRADGVVSQVGTTTTVHAANGIAGSAAPTVGVSGSTIVVTVTGVAAQNINWRTAVRRTVTTTG